MKRSCRGKFVSLGSSEAGNLFVILLDETRQICNLLPQDKPCLSHPHPIPSPPPPPPPGEGEGVVTTVKLIDAYLSMLTCCSQSVVICRRKIWKKMSYVRQYVCLSIFSNCFCLPVCLSVYQYLHFSLKKTLFGL